MHTQQIINDVIVSMQGTLTDEQLSELYNRMIIISADYSIEKRCTELSCVVDYLPESAIEYITTRCVEGMAKSTGEAYLYTLRKFFEYVKLPVENIKKSDVISYIYSRKVSDTTLARELTVVKTFFNWLVDNEYIQKNPCRTIRPIKTKRKMQTYLTAMELEMLRSACSNAQEKAIVEFFYSTGCRVSEVINTNKSDIDFKEGTVKVIGKGSKERIVYLSARSIVALKEYFLQRSDDNEALFVTSNRPHNRIGTRESYQRIFKILYKRAGITKRVHPHTMRHTNATHALENGMPIEEVKEMLGHTSIDTTLVYAAVANSKVKQSHRKCVI